jgi:hypothetical protein
MQQEMEMNEQDVKKALQKCHRSIIEERKGELRAAYELLQEGVAILKEQLKVAPPKKIDILKTAYQVNWTRLKNLESMLEKEEQETADSEDRNIPKEDIMHYTGDNLYDRDFQDNELQYKDPQLPPLPKEPEFRPFAMMKRIWDTMDNDGGYLTEALFIPKYIWFQKKTFVPDIEKKVEYWERIKKEFKKFGIIYNKNWLSKEQAEIQNLVENLSGYQHMIFEDFPSLKPYSEETKKDEFKWNKLINKGLEFITQKIAKSANATSTREYAKCLKDLFIETYFIEEILEKNRDEKLLFVCEFLNEVVLSLALNDIKYLTKEYLKLMKQESLLKKHDKE